MESGRRPGAFSPIPGTPTTPTGPVANHQRSTSSDSDSYSSQYATLSPKRSPYQQRGPYIQQSASSSSSSLQNFSRPSINYDRKTSPLNPITDGRGHKRNNSQGFFEPSLPTATNDNAQIAAQAAMQPIQHARRRSSTIPMPQSPDPPPPVPPIIQRRPSNNDSLAAATAAYPRNAPLSPGLTSFAPPQEKEKQKDRKLKLFRPRHIAIPGKEAARDRPLPSPGKTPSIASSMLSKASASTTSLVDTPPPSIYRMQNSSSSTLVPEKSKPDDKHRHHLFSRQKLKLKDKDEPLALSSASSNSKPTDPNAPQPLYSFAPASFVPASPGLAQGPLSKSVSGFDIRHGGRALRDKRREDLEKRENWYGSQPYPPAGQNSSAMFGIPTGADLSQSSLQGFGLNNITSDEAWDFLKAKLLIIFEGEELRMPVEDLNLLVIVHVQRYIQKKAPHIITEDVEDLLRMGFYSFSHSLTGVPDERLIPYLVNYWTLAFGTILPYMQAVFLPLDLEFKGHGAIMSQREAAEFWGFDFDSDLGPIPEIRRFVLLSFRDNVVLPRHDSLKALFSRLSLESINSTIDSLARPGTAGSLDPKLNSYNSQGSTLLGDESRSRATSNTSAPELPPFSPSIRQTQQMDSSKVTETVGAMLQCMSVLSSLQSDDEAQEKIEDLTKTLKLNWLGRGRTGRNRKGFVGARVPKRIPAV